MNVDNLSADELLGYLYIRGNLSDVERALVKHLEEALDALRDKGK